MTNAPDIVLLGDPVSQSRSPAFQNAGFAAIGSPLRYGVRRVDPAGVRAAISELRAGELVGLNVTSPHKALALSLADERTPDAARSGAANVLWRAGETVWADNTDIAGVRATLSALNVVGGTVVVLGAGGAAAAAALAAPAGSTVTVVNRTPEKAAALVSRVGPFVTAASSAGWDDEPSVRAAFGAATAVINATTLSLVGEPAATAFDRLPWADLAPGAALVDLTYAAGPTPFLRRAPAGARTLDGATMLLHQGVAAFRRWADREAPVAVMRNALAEALGRSPTKIG